jgi:hypothetical protein
LIKGSDPGRINRELGQAPDRKHAAQYRRRPTQCSAPLRPGLHGRRHGADGCLLRSRDLVSVPWGGSAEGRGTEYGEFVVQTVVPAVDRQYRSIAERSCRGIGGAISALQIGLNHPDSFGLVLVFSPVLGDPAIASYLAAIRPVIDQIGRSDFLIDFDDDLLGTADGDGSHR